MPLIVQKFGGTSVADEAARACLAAKAAEARARGDEVVLVVSAMGRRGASYATDTLLDLLRGFDPDPVPLASDLLASCGEVISACLVSALLRAKGIPSVPMTAYTAGIRAEGPFQDARPLGADAEAIRAVLGAGAVPVITGFQAVGPGGQLLTLGRGGSDTSAVLVGLALQADYVDIYTDVPGVAKADPRIIPEAPFMDFLDYGSMSRLAALGAKVLHDKSAFLAESGGAILRVRSTFDSGEGTLIGPAGAPGRSAPDFVGLALSKDGSERARVGAVFASGRGAALKARAERAASALGCSPIPQGDPDASIFSCEQARSGELARALFEAIEGA
ncbi:MAG TPA: hypothetical protein P5133_16045 [Spirochaetia bacterium]|nr:hypothetical protein [Spirochaetia bacterium]